MSLGLEQVAGMKQTESDDDEYLEDEYGYVCEDLRIDKSLGIGLSSFVDLVTADESSIYHMSIDEVVATVIAQLSIK